MKFNTKGIIQSKTTQNNFTTEKQRNFVFFFFYFDKKIKKMNENRTEDNEKSIEIIESISIFFLVFGSFNKSPSNKKYSSKGRK